MENIYGNAVQNKQISRADFLFSVWFEVIKSYQKFRGHYPTYLLVSKLIFQFNFVASRLILIPNNHNYVTLFFHQLLLSKICNMLLELKKSSEFPTLLCFSFIYRQKHRKLLHTLAVSCRRISTGTY